MSAEEGKKSDKTVLAEVEVARLRERPGNRWRDGIRKVLVCMPILTVFLGVSIDTLPPASKCLTRCVMKT